MQVSAQLELPLSALGGRAIAELDVVRLDEDDALVLAQLHLDPAFIDARKCLIDERANAWMRGCGVGLAHASHALRDHQIGQRVG